MNSLEDIRALFADLREQTDWNVDGPLTWGYYFTDTARDRLKPLADHLAAHGYRFVELYATEDNKRYFLHMERTERLRPETLFNRNQQMEALTAEFGVETFDGIDVEGPPD
jgi:hypothetical protein